MSAADTLLEYIELDVLRKVMAAADGPMETLG